MGGDVYLLFIYIAVVYYFVTCLVLWPRKTINSVHQFIGNVLLGDEQIAPLESNTGGGVRYSVHKAKRPLIVFVIGYVLYLTLFKMRGLGFIYAMGVQCFVLGPCVLWGYVTLFTIPGKKYRSPYKPKEKETTTGENVMLGVLVVPFALIGMAYWVFAW